MCEAPRPATATDETGCLSDSGRVLVRSLAGSMTAAALRRPPWELRRTHARTGMRAAAALALIAVLAPAAAHSDGEPADSSAAAPVPPSAMEQRAWAGDYIGSWTLGDGSVVFSTGRPQRDGVGFDPTMPQSAPQYPLAIMPYVGDDPWPQRRR